MATDDGPTVEDRLPLDVLVDQLRDPTFASRHRRPLSLRESSLHINPLMLAVSHQDSVYVRDWRDHASHCEACGKLFAYFGFE